MNSREKGKRGELELAEYLREHGFEGARRGQQYCGANGDADVVGLPGFHIECKRVERLNIHEAMLQSESDADIGEIPVVMHRKNHTDWLCTLPLSQFLRMASALYAYGEIKKDMTPDNVEELIMSLAGNDDNKTDRILKILFEE